MDDQPAAVTNAPARPDLTIQPEPKPARSPFEMELLGLAVDANELASRIHAGQWGDLNAVIRRAIDERPTAEEIASGPTPELRDAA